ncbi:MAG: transcriptional repressor [Deltaproteobacteria bacterium]|nr:transcriptional repressor [Deltaproteobacteria bacterium]
MADPYIRLNEMLEKLKGRNFRITPQRFAVLKILALSDAHPSVEMIYEEVKKDFPTTSIATVYKTVSLLKDLNEVLELGFPEGSNRYDGNNPFPHPHLICVRCKKILDPNLDSLGDMTQELAAETGFEIISHRLGFFGICPGCKEKSG